jgi:FkbM family methyltransferase
MSLRPGEVLMPERSPFAGRVMRTDSPEFDPSPPDPTAFLVPFLRRDPKWFFIVGLGDGNEGTCALRRWPGVRLIGVDPDPRAIKAQRDGGWPAGHTLVRTAMSDRDGTAEMGMFELCCASMYPEHVARVPPAGRASVRTRTVDRMEQLYGPFPDVVLWVDAEGHDLEVLRGASGLLSSDRVLLVNTEVWYKAEPRNRELDSHMTGLGYRRLSVWFRQWWGHNEIWGK